MSFFGRWFSRIVSGYVPIQVGTKAQSDIGTEQKEFALCLCAFATLSLCLCLCAFATLCLSSYVGINERRETMEIRMPILTSRYYRMVMRFKDWEKPGMCFHLRVQELTPEERKPYEGLTDKRDIPTCRIIFYDFEYHRILDGRIKENTEDKLVLDMGGGKEYEFSPFTRSDKEKDSRREA